MSRMVATVFKVLFVSIMLMLLMSVVFNVSDIITVHRRVDQLSILMRSELEQNDCIPNSIAPLLNQELSSIVSRSTVAYKIKWNLTFALQDKTGTLAAPIDQASLSSGTINYGDPLTLVIKVYMQPHFLTFFSNPSSNSGSFLGSTAFNYVNTYSWTVPALRYLK